MRSEWNHRGTTGRESAPRQVRASIRRTLSGIERQPKPPNLDAPLSLPEPRPEFVETLTQDIEMVEQRLGKGQRILRVFSRNRPSRVMSSLVANDTQRLCPLRKRPIDQTSRPQLTESSCKRVLSYAVLLAGPLNCSSHHYDAGRVGLRLKTAPGLFPLASQRTRNAWTDAVRSGINDGRVVVLETPTVVLANLHSRQATAFALHQRPFRRGVDRSPVRIVSIPYRNTADARIRRLPAVRAQERPCRVITRPIRHERHSVREGLARVCTEEQRAYLEGNIVVCRKGRCRQHL